ncbi:MAG: HYExAFE family protein [Planctomycetota bacterium]|nr:HYExAFE family protein [Planctomycetota bacterium]
MADRTVHYEAAFEAYLREHGVPYVAVDEAKKALFSNARLKSFDFVVYNMHGRNLLVDVKGRQAKGKASSSSFQTWTTEQDVVDLLQWQAVFGDGFTAVLMFVYWIDPPVAPQPGMFMYRDRWYLLLGVELSEYQEHMRRRSLKWETVAVPQADFRSLARPIEGWL